MKESRSFILYVFLFIFIGYMYINYINPNTGNKLLICTDESITKGITTFYKVKVDYIDGKFNRVDLKVTRDLSGHWDVKDEEKNLLEEEISAFKDMGFIYEVFFDNQVLTAEVEGTKEKLADNIIYTRRVSDVRKHYETQGYTCEVEQ